MDGRYLRLQAQTVVEYIHTDALGTPVAITNAAGTVIERSVYEPYGSLINRPLTDGPGFTGHVQDAATGLTYMQQRHYDPMIGRFLSVDPVTANSGTGANFNRYWYANNNPYKFNDPDGRAPCRADNLNCDPMQDPVRQRQCEMTCLQNGRSNKDGKSTHSKKESPITTLETTTVSPDAKDLGKTGWYGSAMTPNHTVEVVAAYGAGARYKRNIETKKDALGIVFLGVGARGTAPSRALGAPSIDLLKGGYSWGGTDAPVDIELNGAIGPMGIGLEFDPGKGLEISLNAAIGGGSYLGGSVMFDDTLVPD